MLPARGGRHGHYASASAAGLGVGSAAEAGTPVYPVYPPKLRLRQDLQNRDLFFFEAMDTGSTAAGAGPDLTHRFFLDPEGRQTAELEYWLGLAEHRYYQGRPVVPLFINGQVKTGKSYMLNEVLPAVANTYYCSGGSSSGRQQHAAGAAVLSEPNFLRVNCFACERANGVGGWLRHFLLKLKRSAANQHLSAAASTPVPSGHLSLNAGTVTVAIHDFMERLPRDRLNFLLVDEAHSFFLFERPLSLDCPPHASTSDSTSDSTQPYIRQLYWKPKPDWNAVLDMRRLLKVLFQESPPWVAWAITGNAMTLSANMASYPIHGFVFIDHRCLNLSPTVPMGVLQVAWERLKTNAEATGDRALPDELLWRSPPQIAMLAYLCQEWEWNNSRTANTAAELVEQTMKGQLILQLLADLRNLLQVLGQPAAQLALLRELLDPMGPGVERDKAPLSYTVLLSSFASKRKGRLHLDYPLLAHVIQEINTDSAEVFECIMEHQWISSPMFRELVVLGECCGGGEEEDHPERFPDSSYEDDLHGLLEDMASELALTPNGLLEADWFIQVLDHRCNSLGDKANFEREYRFQARQDVKVGLRWFHALLRNVLSRGSPSEQKQALAVYPPKLTQFHSSGRIREVLTKMHDSSLPSRRSKVPGASAPATPRA